MKDEIEKILNDLINPYLVGANVENTKNKILQLFNDKIDSCTHPLFLELVRRPLSANDIINIIKGKVNE